MAGKGLVLTGARARLSLDGVPVMYSLSCNYGESIQRDPIEPLDQYDVAEFVPIAYRVRFSAQMVRIITQSIKLRDGVSIFPTLENILTQKSLTATIEDRVTGLVVANILNVEATEYNVNAGARSLWLTDVQFVATRIRDESEIV